MARKFSLWLANVSTGWVALACLLIFVLFTALVLPAQSTNSDALTGGGESPDTSIYYTAKDLYRIAESYGEAGRRAYIRARLTFDVVWPLVYTAFLATALSWLYKRAFSIESIWQYANLAPVLGAILDFLENFSTVRVMLRYPQQSPVVASLAGLLTTTKWVFVGGSFILLLIGGLGSIWQRMHRSGK